MPKECDCTEESLGLATLYPIDFNYCTRCGKRLVYISNIDLLKKIDDIEEALI